MDWLANGPASIGGASDTVTVTVTAINGLALTDSPHYNHNNYFWSLLESWFPDTKPTLPDGDPDAYRIVRKTSGPEGHGHGSPLHIKQPLATTASAITNLYSLLLPLLYPTDCGPTHSDDCNLSCSHCKLLLFLII